MLAGTYNPPGNSTTAVLIDRTAGSNIGNMTSNAGLAGAFDGLTNQALTGCASRGAVNGYVGKTLAAAKKFHMAIVYGSNNSGFGAQVGVNFTVTIYGKTGAAPSSGTDGTSLGTITFVDTADESAGREIASTDLTSSWDHLWAYCQTAGVAGCIVAELVLYELA